MQAVPLGAKGTFALTVRPEHLANQFKDAILPQVLATPVMILIMENAALNAIRSYLDPGESAVGTAVNVRHAAATPVGHRVQGEAEVTRHGSRLSFATAVFRSGDRVVMTASGIFASQPAEAGKAGQ